MGNLFADTTALQGKLRQRDIEAWRNLVCADLSWVDRLCRCAVEADGREAENAAWILSHVCAEALPLITPWQYPMAQKAQTAAGPTLRRLLLSVLLSQPLERYKSSDLSFFDWCLSLSGNPAEQVSVRTLCIKHALACAAGSAELLAELCLLLELLLDTSDSAAVLSAARNALARARRLMAVR